MDTLGGRAIESTWPPPPSPKLDQVQTRQRKHWLRTNCNLIQFLVLPLDSPPRLLPPPPKANVSIFSACTGSRKGGAKWTQFAVGRGHAHKPSSLTAILLFVVVGRESWARESVNKPTFGTLTRPSRGNPWPHGPGTKFKKLRESSLKKDAKFVSCSVVVPYTN